MKTFSRGVKCSQKICWACETIKRVGTTQWASRSFGVRLSTALHLKWINIILENIDNNLNLIVFYNSVLLRMIQDLRLALKGVPGAIFTFDDDGSFRKFSRKEPSILYVGGEIDILNNILELGTLRAKIYEYTSTSEGKYKCEGKSAQQIVYFLSNPRCKG